MTEPLDPAIVAQFNRFVGHWSGAETVHDTRRPVASSGYVRYQPDVGGTVLMQQYSQEQEGRIVFRGHGVMTVEPGSGDVLWWWFDSLGVPPLEPARGRWEGDTLTFHRRGHGAELRHRYAFHPGGHRFTAERREDGESDFSMVIEADYVHDRLSLHAT